MEDGLRTVMKEYIDQVNDVCLRLLAGLCLKSKADFLCSRKLRWGIEYEINGTKYLLHGAGCRACDGERYLDWNFGYGTQKAGAATLSQMSPLRLFLSSKQSKT